MRTASLTEPNAAPPERRPRPRLAVILIHYHTPDLAAEALAALRSDLDGSGIQAEKTEWLLVDNGSDARERALLERLPAERIDPGANLGYAGGVNLGAARSTAEVLILMNPDVLVLPGCVPALLERLESGAAVAGPAFWWDRGRRMLLPPAEERTRSAELVSVLAARKARHRWRRHARQHWEAREPLASHSLSGSLLAVRRDAWERVGTFDEGYRLFFEETDWLLRARDLGLRCEYVPAAEAVHLYSQSASREPRAQQWFEGSARRFRERWYGARFARLLEGLGGLSRSPAASGLREIPAAGLDLTGFPFPLWIEVSPNPTGFPAAAEFLDTPQAVWRLPDEIAERSRGAVLGVRAVNAAGQELDRWVLRTA
ncbi:MAG TPA: glycosyltransferase [Thermoanaerobaculia bacterium]|jgi:GT2 family glycosyltransferase|nr:glycosyltransferase [Thermoanaerobaculia bacterium]